MTFTHGELFERSFESEGRIVELLAEIVIVGARLELRDIAIYPRDAGRLAVPLGTLIGWGARSPRKPTTRALPSFESREPDCLAGHPAVELTSRSGSMRDVHERTTRQPGTRRSPSTTGTRSSPSSGPMASHRSNR